SLTSLPPEVILDICDHLPLDDVLSLTLTHVQFQHVLSSLPRARNATPSDCARFAIRAYLNALGPAGSHQRCIRCKKDYPVDMFTSANSPAWRALEAAVEHTPSVQLPARVCAHHLGALA
ncbi:hypothetical protein T440DRAFT_361971, partial [Plenodomus tracheiphilus IPT5]